MNFNIHDLIKFKVEGTNTRYLRYLCRDYAHFKTDEPIDSDIDIFIADFTPDNNGCYIINHKHWVKEGYIFTTHRHKIVKWKVCLIGLAEKKTTVYFSGSTFGEVFLRDYILEPLISLKLTAKGFSLLHASGITVNNKGFIFPACKGVGKTSTILNLIGEGAFLGNDKVILSKDGTVYSYPTSVHIFHYNLSDIPQAFKFLSLKQKAEAKIKHLLNRVSLGYASFPLDINPQELQWQIGKSHPLQSLILLTKTNKNHTNIIKRHDKERLIKQLIAINKWEMQYFDDLISAYLYSYSRKNSNLAGYWHTFGNNLACALNTVPCYEVEIPEQYTTHTYSKIFNELLKQDKVEML